MYFVADFGLAGQIHRRSGDGMPSPGGSTDGFPPVGHRRRPSKAHTNVIMTNVRGNPQASFWVNRRDRHELSRCRASGRFDPAQSPYMRRVRRGGADPAAHRLPAARVLTAARHPLATRHGTTTAAGLVVRRIEAIGRARLQLLGVDGAHGSSASRNPRSFAGQGPGRRVLAVALTPTGAEQGYAVRVLSVHYREAPSAR